MPDHWSVLSFPRLWVTPCSGTASSVGFARQFARCWTPVASCRSPSEPTSCCALFLPRRRRRRSSSAPTCKGPSHEPCNGWRPDDPRTAARPATSVLVGVIRVYQVVLSPLSGPTCKYYPSCSQYAVVALRTHGALRGTGLALWRILRCNPWSLGGVDDVPPARRARAVPWVLPPWHRMRLLRPAACAGI